MPWTLARPLLLALLAASLAGPSGAQELVERSAPFEVEVDLGDGPEAVPVEGRLTWRKDHPPGVRRPGVLLIHGSNAGARLRKDVDGTIPAEDTTTGRPARRFRDLAHALARAGFVVYRHAKRGYAGDPAEDRLDVVATITLARTTADSRRALGRLRACPRVDPDRVLLVGHSEGTMVAPALAAGDEGIAALVLLGTVVDFDRVVRYQAVGKPVADAFRAFDADGDDRISRTERADALRAPGGAPVFLVGFARADADGDGAVSRAEARALRERVAYRPIREQARDPESYWHGHFAAPRNLDRLPGLDVPLVVVQGELDWRTPSAHVRELERALAGHPDATFRYYPGLGHGLSPPRDPPGGGWAPEETAGPPDPDVLAELGGLLRERFLTGAAD